jgi:AraC family transcriptional regulator
MTSADLEIVQQPALRVAAVRHTGPYHEIGGAFRKLDGLLKGTGLTLSGAGLVALYHDDPAVTPADKLRSDAGIVIPEEAPLPRGLTEQRAPTGNYARVLRARTCPLSLSPPRDDPHSGQIPK